MTTTIQAPSTETLAAVRTAYQSLVTEPNGYVGLAAIRTALAGTDRDEVTAAFYALAMGHRAECDMIPVANLKGLTSEDRDAAISLGGENINAIRFYGQAPVTAWVARKPYTARHAK